MTAIWIVIAAAIGINASQDIGELRRKDERTVKIYKAREFCELEESIGGNYKECVKRELR